MKKKNLDYYQLVDPEDVSVYWSAEVALYAFRTDIEKDSPHWRNVLQATNAVRSPDNCPSIILQDASDPILTVGGFFEKYRGKPASLRCMNYKFKDLVDLGLCNQFGEIAEEGAFGYSQQSHVASSEDDSLSGSLDIFDGKDTSADTSEENDYYSGLVQEMKDLASVLQNCSKLSTDLSQVAQTKYDEIITFLRTVESDVKTQMSNELSSQHKGRLISSNLPALRKRKADGCSKMAGYHRCKWSKK